MPSSSAYHRKMDEAEKEPKSKDKSKGKVRSIHIDKAKNGYTVSHEREQAEGKEMPTMRSPKPSVFEQKDDALDHVAQLMGDTVEG